MIIYEKNRIAYGLCWLARISNNLGWKTSEHLAWAKQQGANPERNTYFLRKICVIFTFRLDATSIRLLGTSNIDTLTITIITTSCSFQLLS